MKPAQPSQVTRPPLRASARQREALAKRGIIPIQEPEPVASPPSPAPRSSPAAQRKAIQRRALKTCRKLAKRFPQCFSDTGQAKQPLKVGITADVIAAAPDIHPNDIANAISDYCAGQSYHAAMTEGAHRIDINGDVAGTVNRRAAAYAVWMLKKLTGGAS
jgi:ProP effector